MLIFFYFFCLTSYWFSARISTRNEPKKIGVRNMGLFGEFSFQEKVKKPLTLIQMAEVRFGSDDELMREIRLYLKSCRERRMLPTRVSWEIQLDILQKLPDAQRVESVHNSIVKGYRQIAFINDNKVTNNISNERIKNTEVIVKEGF